MTLWLREVIGWVLLGTGVAAFAVCYLFLTNRWIVEGGILAFVAFVLFRGGMHLLKVAMAARAVRDVRREMAAQANPTGTRPTKRMRPQLAVGPTGRPRKSVVPGLGPEQAGSNGDGR